MRPWPVALVLLLAGSGLSGCLGGGLVGQPAPAFTLATNEGVVVNESSFLGRHVVLDLMATWCGPCRLEVAHLREVQRTFGDRVAILSIGVDPDESPADLAAFAERYGATWPHGIDANGSIGRAYGVGIIPKLVILDPEGNVVFERQGEVLPAAIAQVIDPAGAAASGEDLADAFAFAVLAAVGGFLAAHNPYRRFHRDTAGRRPEWLALAAFALLAAAAWPFAGLVSSRATYGSLAVGALTGAAVVWWLRAKDKPPAHKPPHAWLEAGDRLYEAAPHFALALVLALGATGPLTYALPFAGFLAGAAGGVLTRAQVPAPARDAAGLAGLALAAAGLLVFGGRILVAGA